MKTQKLFEYTFELDGDKFAKTLRSQAKKFGKFLAITEIYGSGPSMVFSVITTLEDLKEFYTLYDLESRGIWFDEASLEEVHKYNLFVDPESLKTVTKELKSCGLTIIGIEGAGPEAAIVFMGTEDDIESFVDYNSFEIDRDSISYD